MSFFTPLARATLATSSRVGLDFGLPAAAARGLTSSAPLAAAPMKPLTVDGQLVRSGGTAGTDMPLLDLRWEPLNGGRYARKSGVTDRAPTHNLSAMCSRNNLILTLSDRLGPIGPSISAGTGSVFKNSAKGNYEASHQAMLKMIARIVQTSRSFAAKGHKMQLGVSFNGFEGTGREAVSAAIAGAEGEEVAPLVCRVEDRTRLKIGGTRGPRPRRV